MDGFTPCHSPFEGWYIDAIYYNCLLCVVDGHGTVLDEAVVQNELKLLLQWPANHCIQLVGAVGTLDLAPVEAILIASYHNIKE